MPSRPHETGRTLRRMSLAAAAAALAACGGDSAATGEWAGTIRDSAGVAVVENPAAGLWTPEEAWRLEEDLRIGAAEGDPVLLFADIDGMAVDSADRIHVLERDAGEIRVFDADGAFIRTIGGPGRGPGELASPGAVLLGAGDTIFVPDSRNQRVQRFLADGTEAGSFPISPADGIPLGWGIRPDGLLLEEVRTLPSAGRGDERILLLARDGGGGIRDTVVDMPVGEAMRIENGQPLMTVFAPEPMWAPLGDGRIATGRNSEYRLEIRSPDGRVERIVQKPFERRPFGESHRRMLRQRLEEHFEKQGPSPGTARMLESLAYADHYPVFAELFAGPAGTLWVRHAKDVPSLTPADMAAFDVRALAAAEFDVFDEDGRLLGTVATPEGFEPMHSRGEHVYGVQRDEMGVQHVARLRVTPRPVDR